MNILEYAKGVEKLVNPMEVGKVHYMQTKMNHLPVFLQRKIITSASKKASKMPFVVEPYCSFLFYEITEPERMQKFLPEEVTTVPYSSKRLSSVTFPPFHAENISMTAYPQEMCC